VSHFCPIFTPFDTVKWTQRRIAVFK